MMPHVSLLLRCGDIAKHFRDVAYKYFLGRVTQTIEYYYYMMSLTHTQKTMDSACKLGITTTVGEKLHFLPSSIFFYCWG